MIRGIRLRTVAAVAAGALVGFLAASDKLNPMKIARAALGNGGGAPGTETFEPYGGCCLEVCLHEVDNRPHPAPATPDAGGAAAAAPSVRQEAERPGPPR
jgi:hypothetical protein